MPTVNRVGVEWCMGLCDPRVKTCGYPQLAPSGPDRKLLIPAPMVGLRGFVRAPSQGLWPPRQPRGLQAPPVQLPPPNVYKLPTSLGQPVRIHCKLKGNGQVLVDSGSRRQYREDINNRAKEQTAIVVGVEEQTCQVDWTGYVDA